MRLAIAALALAACTSEGPGLSDWRVQLETDAEVGLFLGVWGARPNDVYAVGGQTLTDDATRGAAMHWDGTAWTPVELPADTPQLQWAFGVEGELWIVGEQGAILHREGDEWTRHTCGTMPLWGVWGAGRDDVWVVGGGTQKDPILCHYDGSDFAPAPLPDRASTGNALYKVWGSAADDVFAVGDRGLVIHYDGVAWTEQDAGTSFDLIAVWGSGPDDVLAVGGRANGVLARWDGETWESRELSGVPGLSGVWMAPDGVATITGAEGFAADIAAGEWDLHAQPTDTALLLHATFGFPGERQFAVGGSLDQLPPFTGIILDRSL